MREVKLPSGATLQVTPSPFAEARALYQAILRELRFVEVGSKTEISSLYKDLFCIGFASAAVEACLWECFKRCTYDSGKGAFKIDNQTFEPIEARDDFMTVCIEVAKENVLPFGKSLFAVYQDFVAQATKENTPA